MSDFGRVIVTTELSQLDYDRRRDRTRDLKHMSTLTDYTTAPLLFI